MLANLHDSSWWFTAVVVGLLVSVAANLLTKYLDKSWKRRRQRLADLRREEQLEREQRRRDAVASAAFRHHIEMGYLAELIMAEGSMTRVLLISAVCLSTAFYEFSHGTKLDDIYGTTFVVLGLVLWLVYGLLSRTHDRIGRALRDASAARQLMIAEEFDTRAAIEPATTKAVEIEPAAPAQGS